MRKWKAISLTWGMQVIDCTEPRRPKVLAAVEEKEEKNYGPRRTEEVSAVAHLIAAAPDLLAACEAALRVFWTDNDAMGYGTDEQGQIAAQMREAIAKAKGE